MAKMGTIYKVENKEPGMNAAAHYLALFVEDEDGDNERWLLFTQKEWDRLSKLDCGEWGADLKAGRLLPMSLISSMRSSYLLRADVDGTAGFVRITGKAVANAEARAKANPEDLPSRSWLEDMKD